MRIHRKVHSGEPFCNERILAMLVTYSPLTEDFYTFWDRIGCMMFDVGRWM